MSVLETRVSSPLASALQADMLATALILRDLLYDDRAQRFHNKTREQAIENALIALDFPHFIPVANTKDALIAEYHHYEDMWWQSLEDADDLITCNSGEKADDLHKHLLTRDASLPQTPRVVEETQEFPALTDELSICDQCGKSVTHPDQAVEVAGYYCSQKCFDDSCEPQADTDTKLPDLETEISTVANCAYCTSLIFEDDEDSLTFSDGVFCDIHCSNMFDDEGGE